MQEAHNLRAGPPPTMGPSNFRPLTNFSAIDRFKPITISMEWDLQLHNEMSLQGFSASILAPYQRPRRRKCSSANAYQLTCQAFNDDDFALLSSILPPEPTQRSAISNRKVIDAFFWHHVTGKRFTQLPDQTAMARQKLSGSALSAGLCCGDHVLDEIDALGHFGVAKGHTQAYRRQRSQAGQTNVSSEEDKVCQLSGGNLTFGECVGNIGSK